MAKDLHDRPFDEGTLVKLSLYRDYLRQWLPVFLGPKEPRFHTVNIFDFFAGPGRDAQGRSGSPLIAIEELQPHLDSVSSKGLDLHIYFNEIDSTKLQQLQSTIECLDLSNQPLQVHFRQEDFRKAFDELYKKMSAEDTANFLFLDQNGIRHVSDYVFGKIVRLRRTDVLFFISSSIMSRFHSRPEIRRHMALPESTVEATKYTHIHRLLLEHYRDMVPEEEEYYLAPFSIKKGANVYGLIFGTHHVLGIDKFLHACWRVDPQTGDSNFDIDEECIDPEKPSLFPDMDKPSKVVLFEQALRGAILSKKLETNKDVYVYALRHGFLPRHAKAVCGALKREGVLKEIPNISYGSCKKRVREQRIRCI